MSMDSVVISGGTILDGGYGILSRSVMRDPDLKSQAKAIYAYICAFAAPAAGGDRTAFPSVALQCKELGMSEDTYYRHRKSLEKKGYLEIKKERGPGGKFLRNLYTVALVPVPVPDPEPVDTVDNSIPDNLGYGAPNPKNPGMDNPRVENSGTKSTSLKSTRFKNDDDDYIAFVQNLNSENYELLKTQLQEKGFSAENVKSICNKLAKERVSFQLVLPVIDLAISFYYEGQRHVVVSSVPAFFYSQYEKALSHVMLENNVTAAKMAEIEAAAASAPLPFYNWLEN